MIIGTEVVSSLHFCLYRWVSPSSPWGCSRSSLQAGTCFSLFQQEQGEVQMSADTQRPQGAGLQGSGQANKSSKHLCNEDTPAPHKAQLHQSLQSRLKLLSWHVFLPRDQFCHLTSPLQDEVSTRRGDPLPSHSSQPSKTKAKPLK